MTTKKAPLTLKEFMASSLIVNYPCNRSSSKSTPRMITNEDFVRLCQKMKSSTQQVDANAAQLSGKTRE